MNPVLRPASRRRAKALPAALSLLVLPALAPADDVPGTPNPGHESATESHRRVEPDAGAPATAAAEPSGSGTSAKPAGDRPVPVEPGADDRDTSEDGAPGAEGARRRARAFDHDSVLEDYTAYEESDAPNWIDANRIVGEIGGWRTYARELYESSVEEGEGR